MSIVHDRKRSFGLASCLLPILLGVTAAACTQSEPDDDEGASEQQQQEQPVCGDGVCSPGETDACADCGEQPPPEPVCGNGVCEAGETSACSDCAEEDPPVCGNGVCEPGETSACADCVEEEETATVVVQNFSSYDIWYLYIVPCGASSWGSDLLGSDILYSGWEITFNDAPVGCYNFRAETAGAEIYWESYGEYVDPGETFEWTLVD